MNRLQSINPRTQKVRILSRTARFAAIFLALALATSAQQPEMIDVGGHKLQMTRSGAGAATVVFEAGIGGPSVWGALVSRIATFSTTVSYAHAGMDGSEPAQSPRTPTRLVEELHTLLHRAKISPPYILVGHSMGGLETRLFAMTYPTEVAGIVLIDGSHERQVLEFTRLDPAFVRRREAALNALNPAQRAEMDGLWPILSTGKLNILGKLPDVPTVVITSLLSTSAQGPGAVEAHRQLDDEIFRSVSYGMHIITNRSGHLIQKDEPELVANAIRWVIDATNRR